MLEKKQQFAILFLLGIMYFINSSLINRIYILIKIKNIWHKQLQFLKKTVRNNVRFAIYLP